MNQEKKKKKGIAKGIIAVVLIACVGAGAYYMFFMKDSVNGAETEYSSTSAQVGDVSQTISGSGTLEPLEQFDITSLVQGDITEDYIEIGQEVEEGELAYVIDDDDLDLTILKAENSLSNAQTSYEDLLEDISDLTLYSDYTGTVSELYVDSNDSISSGASIADIVNSKELITNTYFNTADAANMSVGEAATVYIEATGESLTGSVTDIATGESVSANGAVVKLVEITFTNPGALTEGDYVTVMVGDYACSAASTIEYSVVETIYADASGDISTLNIAEGDYITKGSLVLKLDGDDLNENIEDAQLAIQEAEMDLENTKEEVDEYEITSPISGTVVDKDYQAGDKLDDSKTTLAVVADMSKLIFTMDVDELDISTIETGMTVKVYADAVEDQEYEGVITSVGILGTTSDGVTTYPVEVEVDEYDGLLPGMNVTADIVAEEVTDVIMIPMTAVQRGDMVIVTEEYANSIGAEILEASAGMSAMNEAGSDTAVAMKSDQLEDGYVYLKVETGLNNDTYVEIISGLTEDAVVYELVSSSSDTGSSEEEDGGMMMPGMDGGGGAPSDGGGGGQGGPPGGM